MKVKVAVLQYDPPEQTGDSFSKLEVLTAEAAKQGAKLVVAPETAVGNVSETKNTTIDNLPALSDIARCHQVFLATSFYQQEGDKFLDRGYIIAPDGKPVLSHAKIYPAKSELEELGVRAGDELMVADTQIGRLGMLICKDGFNKYSHFLYEKFNDLGVDIICIPSWSIGWKEMNIQEYVKSLFVYGAFSGRSYVLMSDCINKTLNSFGRSLIISPVRGVLREGSVDKEEILIETLDLDEVKRAREFDSWWQPAKRRV